MEYCRIDGVHGLYFVCPHGMGKLSTGACADSYVLAMSQRGRAECLRYRCRGCATGALHAGDTLAGERVGRFAGWLRCSRCTRPASKLVRGRVCVSCYNREREYLRGRNAKGGFPRFVPPVLRRFFVRERRSAEPAAVVAESCVTHAVEVALSRLRAGGGRRVFFWGAAWHE